MPIYPIELIQEKKEDIIEYEVKLFRDLLSNAFDSCLSKGCKTMTTPHCVFEYDVEVENEVDRVSQLRVLQKMLISKNILTKEQIDELVSEGMKIEELEKSEE